MLAALPSDRLRSALAAKAAATRMSRRPEASSFRSILRTSGALVSLIARPPLRCYRVWLRTIHPDALQFQLSKLRQLRNPGEARATYNPANHPGGEHARHSHVSAHDPGVVHRCRRDAGRRTVRIGQVADG